jgi:hypothetical protein
MHQGSCLCGTVRYEVQCAIKSIVHCHCSMCRKAHGAAFSSYAPVPAQSVRIVEGISALSSYRSSDAVSRIFCRHCGTTLHWHDAKRFKDWISVAVATLDTVLDCGNQQHAFVWSKASWYELKDSFPKHRYAVVRGASMSRSPDEKRS